MKQISIFDMHQPDHPLYHHEINQYYLKYLTMETIGHSAFVLYERFGEELFEYTKELHDYIIKKYPIINYSQWFKERIPEIGVGELTEDETWHIPYFHIFLRDKVYPVRVYSEIPQEFWLSGGEVSE